MKNLLILAIIFLSFSFANAQSDWKLFGMAVVKNDISYANRISSPDLKNLGIGVVYRNESFLKNHKSRPEKTW